MLLLAAMMWGMSYSVQDLIGEKLSNYTIIFLKGFSGYLIILFCLITKRKFTKETVLAGILIGLNNGIGLLLQQIGLSMSTVSKTSFISGLYILFVPVIGLITGKKPKNKIWFSIFIACIGMYFLCINDTFGISIGDVLVLISDIFFAMQIILIDRHTNNVDVVPFCGVQQATTSIMSGIMMLAFGRPQIADFKGLIQPILFLIFFPGMIAQLLQNRYQRDVEPTLSSLLLSFESVFGALGGWLLLNQTLTARETLGCIIIFIAILIAE